MTHAERLLALGLVSALSMASACSPRNQGCRARAAVDWLSLIIIVSDQRSRLNVYDSIVNWICDSCTEWYVNPFDVVYC